MMMDLNNVELICREFGVVKYFDQNEAMFGNVNLEILTPNNTKLCITSDRGDFSCYVKQTVFFIERLIPINEIVNTSNQIVFTSLVEAVEFIKTNLSRIEKETHHK